MYCANVKLSRKGIYIAKIIQIAKSVNAILAFLQSSTKNRLSQLEQIKIKMCRKERDMEKERKKESNKDVYRKK